MADDPEPSEASPEGTHFALTATITVSAEIDAGTTIEVNVDDVVARFDDGAPIAVAISQPQTIRIDDRGEPDSVVIAAADSTGGFFYIVDMLFPAIPPDVESEGTPGRSRSRPTSRPGPGRRRTREPASSFASRTSAASRRR